MKKLALILTALLGVATLVHANTSSTCTVFQGLNCNNSGYNCNINIGSGQQISDCTFTFTSCNTQYDYLSCNLGNYSENCNLGSQNGSCQTWTCTLNSQQLQCLNDCLNYGNCNFNLNCQGNWNIQNCTCNYSCKPKTVPDGATTIYLLGAVLAGLEIARRLNASAKLAAIKK